MQALSIIGLDVKNSHILKNITFNSIFSVNNIYNVGKGGGLYVFCQGESYNLSISGISFLRVTSEIKGSAIYISAGGVASMNFDLNDAVFSEISSVFGSMIHTEEFIILGGINFIFKNITYDNSTSSGALKAYDQIDKTNNYFAIQELKERSCMVIRQVNLIVTDLLILEVQDINLLISQQRGRLTIINARISNLIKLDYILKAIDANVSLTNVSIT